MSVSTNEAEAIMQEALVAEGPPAVKGARPVTVAELRLQRRMALILTVVPLLGVAAAMVMLWGRGISPLDFGLFLGFWVLTGLGITVGFHRLFTHRSFEVGRPLRVLWAVAGTMAVEGSVIHWVATHRRHHAYADTYGDPHSPHLVEETGIRGTLRGLWHAHAGWFFIPDGIEPTHWAPDLLRDPALVRVERAAPWIIVGSIVAPPIIGGLVTMSVAGALSAFIWGSLVRIFVLHHITWSINSICHFFGDQPFETRDESVNNWPLSVVSFGESWHNNHHAFPTSARHGLLPGQIDLSWRVIRTLEQIGLADNVHLPTPEQLAKKRRSSTSG
ncbi:acyl-CoA desaturase [Euzebya tangerina]|uniref:acyl-CoA desaturase n=1 Tax=Euzebya tangerina TaxID=591198 RepID=UPI00147434C6|nr:acyl-CoA desaturase [Euzebya tangerina]